MGDTELIGGDALPGTYQRPRGFSLMLSLDDADVAERLFQALGENGTVNTAFQETFWALRYGGVTDQFGIAWEINCERPQ